MTHPLPYADILDLVDAANRRLREGDLPAALSTLTIAEERCANSGASAAVQVAVLTKKAEVLIRRASFITSNFAPAREVLAVAEPIARRSYDRRLLADVVYGLARVDYGRIVTSGEGDLHAVDAGTIEVLKLQQTLGNEPGVLDALLYRGYVAEQQGMAAVAKGFFQAVRVGAIGLALPDQLAEAERHLGFYFLGASEPLVALVHFERSLAILEATGYKLVIPFALLTVGDAYRQLKQSDNAMSCYDDALVVARARNFSRGIVQLLLSKGDLLLDRSDRDAARASFGEALEVARASSYPRGREAAEARLAAH